MTTTLAKPLLRRHLPGLDGIRALCAITVVIFHTDQSINMFSSQMQSTIAEIGTHHYAVTIFFVLSGFLITLLLLREHQSDGKIDLKRFYLRRTLKIWPLYFLIIGLCFAMESLPGDRFWSSDQHNYIYYLLFIGNYAYSAGKIIIPLIPFWSIGVEEQFYLFWPLMMKAKNVIRALIVFLVAFCLLKVMARLFTNGTPYYLILNTSFSCMAIGGIGAWLAFTNHPLLKVIFNPALQVLSWLALLSLYIRPVHFISLFDNEIYSLFFLVIIANSAYNEKPVLRLDFRALNFVGKISYGIYCWHMLIILLICKVVQPHNIADHWYNRLWISLGILALTVAVASLSFEVFEKQFLKIKDRFGYKKKLAPGSVS
jgi:peptidoglycan/LPS O-acetylase OafA/YrhL